VQYVLNVEKEEVMSSQQERLHALNLPMPGIDALEPDIKGAFNHLLRVDGFVPNVLKSYSFDAEKFRPFLKMYNNVMLMDSPLSTLVSSINRCVYCLTTHGAAVRTLSGDPLLGELLVQNYRVASLGTRHRAMLDFAVKVTEASYAITEADREALRKAGFDDRAIWDITAVVGFFNMSNRMANALDMVPNAEYHFQGRAHPEK
jgi:uncharacterized peroxidase-related enzyme